MVTLDYAVTANFLIGVRAGFVGLVGYRGSAAAEDGRFVTPIEMEARGVYVTGAGVSGTGARGYLMLGAGVGVSTAHVAFAVQSTGSLGGSTVTSTVDAWAIGGPGLAEVGGGFRYAFSESFALLLGPRIAIAFGSGPVLPSLGFELGGQFGL